MPLDLRVKLGLDPEYLRLDYPGSAGLDYPPTGDFAHFLKALR